MAENDNRPDDGSEMDVVRSSAIELIRNAAPGLRRIRVRSGAADIELEWTALAGEPARAAAVQAPVAVEAVLDEGLHYVRSPIVGTFYRAPEPGAKPFVAAGGRVEKGQQIGIVEALKMMNPIEADCSGEVVEVLAADGTPVEFDQRLIAVRTADTP
ncbi:acetyl-CoA carboxylase biotin carboxyl carrier protein [Nonomuraea sp. NPDC050783]|uniref:acetyl-CoA carboxylase biotin carboxyl carrier protein n=1 Tax=Nonomuraea sp. NPDC050783 TaxID=3154634 RepID=UPI003465C8DB